MAGERELLRRRIRTLFDTPARHKSIMTARHPLRTLRACALPGSSSRATRIGTGRGLLHGN